MTRIELRYLQPMRTLCLFSLLVVASCGGDDGGDPPCVPGVAVACVGPGGCAGGQMCRADGSGFAACDCGAGLDASVDGGDAPRDGAVTDSGGDADVTDGAADATMGDAESDAHPTESDAGAVGMCPDGSSLRSLPARPMTPDDGDQQIAIGLRDIRLRQTGDAWRDIGLDLDGLCTHAVDADAECRPRTETDVQIDGNQGIDNAFHSMFDVIDLVFPSLASTAGPTAASGIGVFVLQIEGWNGTANDSRVQVAISQSVAGAAGSLGDTTAPPVEFVDYLPFAPGTTTPLSPPAWAGLDWFWLRDESFFMADISRPRARDDNAFIADGRLVVRVPDRADLIVWGESSGLRLRLTDAHIIGRFDEGFTRLSQVTLSGRWNVLDALESLSSIGICAGDTEYDVFSRKVEEVADVRSLPGSGGPEVSCDAVSFGVTLEGYRVRVAELERGRPLANRCD